MRIHWGIILLLLISSICLPQQQEKIVESVDVKAYIVPLYILTEKGEPVYNLSKSELVLLINGKETSINQLIPYNLEISEDEKVSETKRINKKVAPLLNNSPGRMVYIVMDSIFNSRFGIKRMKEIVPEIMKNGLPNDTFCIIGIDLYKGLFHIAGPSYDIEDMKRKVKKTRFSSASAFVKKLFLSSKTGFVDVSRSERFSIEFIIDQDPYLFLDQITFTYYSSLEDFRFALRIISRPKIVYLISEGVMGRAFKKGISFRPIFIDYLSKIAKTFNEEGTSVFTINSGRIESTGDLASSNAGKFSLQVIAHESGGEFFEGTQIENIVTKIRKTLASYYEAIFFLSTNLMQDQIDIQIKHINQKYKILMPKLLAKQKAFSEFSKFEKRLYVASIINETSLWPRTIGIIKRTDFKILEKSKKRDQINIQMEIDIPEYLQDNLGEVYIIRNMKGTKNAQIKRFDIQMTSTLKRSIKLSKNENCHVVILDPSNGNAAWGKIK